MHNGTKGEYLSGGLTQLVRSAGERVLPSLEALRAQHVRLVEAGNSPRAAADLLAAQHGADPAYMRELFAPSQPMTSEQYIPWVLGGSAAAAGAYEYAQRNPPQMDLMPAHFGQETPDWLKRIANDPHFKSIPSDPDYYPLGDPRRKPGQGE